MVKIKKKGFTIIETLIAAVIAIVVLGGVIYIFKQSRNSMNSAENKLTVLHQGRMLLEYLKRDLRSIYIDDTDSSTKLNITDNSLSFAKSSGENETSPTIEKINYNFFKGEGTITRESDKTGDILFGKKKVKVKSFSIVKETISQGYKKNTFFKVLIELVNRENESKNSILINEKIFPPGLRFLHQKSWVE